MADAFSLLGLAARPWIDPESLKSVFLTQSTSHHPDLIPLSDEASRLKANQCYADVTAAYGVIKSHRDRLALLWQLETGEKIGATAQIPEELALIFIEVGQVCRDAGAFHAENAKLTSPILKAQGYGIALDWINQLQDIQTRVIGLDRVFVGDLQAFDQEWNELDPATRRNSLKQLHFRASCVQRWKEQLHERLAQLAF